MVNGYLWTHRLDITLKNIYFNLSPDTDFLLQYMNQMAKFCLAPCHIVSETPDTTNFTKVIIISQMDDRNRYSMNNVKQNFQQNVNLREDKTYLPVHFLFF